MAGLFRWAGTEISTEGNEDREVEFGGISGITGTLRWESVAGLLKATMGENGLLQALTSPLRNGTSSVFFCRLFPIRTVLGKDFKNRSDVDWSCGSRACDRSGAMSDRLIAIGSKGSLTWFIRAFRREVVSLVQLSYCLERYAAECFRLSFGGEWKAASFQPKRGSIQPRLSFQAGKI